jgi:hypothetical protein
MIRLENIAKAYQMGKVEVPTDRRQPAVQQPAGQGSQSQDRVRIPVIQSGSTHHRSTKRRTSVDLRRHPGSAQVGSAGVGAGRAG